MKPRTAAIWAVVALAVVGFFVFSSPPSDERLLRVFRERQATVEQLQTLFFAEPASFVYNVSGYTFPEEIALSAERRQRYQALLGELGVTRILGDGKRPYMALYFDPPLALPDGPLKSFVYTRETPELLTDGSTSSYVFLPGQYRRVCRPVAVDWYLCLDKET